MSAPPLAPHWRLVVTPPLTGAQNMAVDVALMARARQTGEAVFRIYTWGVPTLSFGRNQTAFGRYDLDEIRARGLGVVRRPTGGRAILHWREVTYSVTAPLREGVGLKPSYQRINQILLDGLRRLQVPVEIAIPTERALRPTDAPCFAAPSAGEMTTNGQKLVGSAQWREDGALLQHGSILIEDDQTVLASLVIQPALVEATVGTRFPALTTIPRSIPQVGTLRDVLGRAPEVLEVATAMFDAVQGIEDPDATHLDSAAVVQVGESAVQQFLDDQWTWRR
ncbi:MAG TPA: lipoate--protein ligase family protein [Gemmatimonadaceae bacterium]|nr:lipoate--protein ligase family protein [Gemmatimonadaceae bacterium]